MSEQRDCERCGNPIPAARLGVLPNTRLCIECSEAIGGDYKTALQEWVQGRKLGPLRYKVVAERYAATKKGK